MTNFVIFWSGLQKMSVETKFGYFSKLSFGIQKEVYLN